MCQRIYLLLSQCLSSQSDIIPIATSNFNFWFLCHSYCFIFFYIPAFVLIHTLTDTSTPILIPILITYRSLLLFSFLFLISSFSSLVFTPVFISFFISFFPIHSILSTEKWGPSVPILTRIIDSEGSDKVLGDCVVFGTLFKEMHLRSSVSVREECSVKKVLCSVMFKNNVLS